MSAIRDRLAAIVQENHTDTYGVVDDEVWENTADAILAEFRLAPRPPEPERPTTHDWRNWSTCQCRQPGCLSSHFRAL